jgi:hypothetical protein
MLFKKTLKLPGKQEIPVDADGFDCRCITLGITEFFHFVCRPLF